MLLSALQRKKTKVDRNRAARRKAAEVAQAAARAAKAKRAALANLPTLLKEIDAEQEELASRRLRRKVGGELERILEACCPLGPRRGAEQPAPGIPNAAWTHPPHLHCTQLDKAETTAGLPPRLGKTKFEGMPLQLLTTDEVNGSLRKLKPTASLAKDRWVELPRWQGLRAGWQLYCRWLAKA